MPLRVQVVFTGIQGSPWLSTFSFSGDTQTEADDAVTATGAFWNAVDALMNTGVSWQTQSDVSQLSLLGVLEGVFSTTPVSGGGATATDVLPPATQGLVSWRTGVIIGGRELRGRTFIPGLTESAADEGNLAAAAQTTIQTAADALIADAATFFQVWSRTHFAASPAATATVQSQFAVQRSRRD